MSDEVAAFVPGHITGFFSAHPADEPTKAGSRGAGLTLSDGVEVTVRPASTTRIALNGSPIEMEPVERVLGALGVDARVSAETDLPLGAGFGVSGAMSLGTALAANAAFGCGHSENELTTVAHGAEVQAGTGLGDVVAQARGGLPIRLEPGAPGYGLLDGIPARARIEYVTFGDLPTEEVLSGDTKRLSTAGQHALSRLVAEPTLPRLMSASRRFAREAGLLTDEVAAAVRDVSEAGGEASMAMLGRTAFALGTGLSDAGYDATACRTHPTGAALLGDEV
ncbi:pantoate kinase [Halegenticoccus soli]|uniref:pantoate kinase n=1 Tax=Halegenticoccus soli TaxID=1985678 RepID=UPI000C6E6015|nr:pantoate kinase [Halegenticoccus soli]